MQDGRKRLTVARDHWCDLRDERCQARLTGTRAVGVAD